MEYSWHRYNSDLGQAAVEWAYTNLLPHKDIMIRPLTLGSPWIERQFVKYCYNIPKKMVWNSQQLSKPVADNALVLIKDIFYEVDQLLSDGRKYLYGDKLTLADLTFAVSGAPWFYLQIMAAINLNKALFQPLKNSPKNYRKPSAPCVKLMPVDIYSGFIPKIVTVRLSITIHSFLDALDHTVNRKSAGKIPDHTAQKNNATLRYNQSGNA